MSDALHGLDYARAASIATHLDTLDYCAHYRHNKKLNSSYKETKSNDSIFSRDPRNCCVSVSSTVSSACDLCLTIESRDSLYHRSSCPVISTRNLGLSLDMLSEDNQNYCHIVHPSYHPSQALSLCCPPSPRTKHSQKRHQTDSYYNRSREQACQKDSFKRTHKWLPGLELETELLNQTVQGLGCMAGNRTLGFVHMDSRHSRMFMERLGIGSSSTAAVIVNIKVQLNLVIISAAL